LSGARTSKIASPGERNPLISIAAPFVFKAGP
jgi:hypothetical protein